MGKWLWRLKSSALLFGFYVLQKRLAIKKIVPVLKPSFLANHEMIQTLTAFFCHRIFNFGPTNCKEQNQQPQSSTKRQKSRLDRNLYTLHDATLQILDALSSGFVFQTLVCFWREMVTIRAPTTWNSFNGSLESECHGQRLTLGPTSTAHIANT